MDRLKDKVILATATTRGIGAAIVEACAKEGAHVYMAARRLDAAQQQADAYNAQGYHVDVVYNDALKRETYTSMVEDVLKKEDHIDVLINNFGTSNPREDKDIMHTDYEVFEKTVTTNLMSVFCASQAVIPHMVHGGSIINISSVSSTSPDISQVAYGTSKAAINYLTKLIATQASAQKVRCNAVLPGMTATDAVKQLSDEFKQGFIKHIPLGRMGTPEEIAAAVVYFASDESAFTTGQILEVAGGFGVPTPVFGDMASNADNR